MVLRRPVWGHNHVRQAPFWVGHASPLLILAGLSSVAWGCGDSETSGTEAATRHGLTEAQASEVLIRVGPREITVGEFAERLASESPYIRPRYNNPENRRDYLHNLVNFELLALEARRRGLHQLPEIQRTREDHMIEALLETRVYSQVQASDISDADIRADFEANPGEYNQPEQRRAEHILVQSKSRAEMLLSRIQEADDKNATFRELSARFSLDDDTRERFGDLRFFSRQARAAADGEEPDREGSDSPDGIPQAVRDATFAIEEIGACYPTPVESSRGFHVVRLRAIRPALERTLEDARRAIQSKLLRQRRQAALEAYLAELRQSTKVVTHLERLDSVDLSVSHESDSDTDQTSERAQDSAPTRVSP